MAMTQVDAMVLGGGIVGTSIALHLVKRGLTAALVDRRPPGEETSYGNAGVIEGSMLLPPAFPSDLSSLLRIALKRSPEANYHLSFLPHVAPWLLAFRAASRSEQLVETAQAMRPMFACAVAEHEALLVEAGAEPYLRKNGWLKLHRSERSFAAMHGHLALAQELGVPFRVLDTEAACVLEPSLAPVFQRALFWQDSASISNPLSVTRAYAARFGALGGRTINADARSLHRAGARWRLDAPEGQVETEHAVVALGPFAPDVLRPLGIDLPLGIKRGYHRHYRSSGNAGLTRPLVDLDMGYCLAPMEQGIRLTTGAEFAARDAPPTPVQFDRLLPAARKLFPLGEQVQASTWMGSRPCFPDSRPVIGRAPGHPGLWLAYGHAHWGLTLGPATGRLLAEMIAGTVPFTDPAPYAAERFTR
ncbi:MAG: FAD-binding oxidoreductase [Alphaproteobacteria bacterium]|nr:MAG: FAD-binding oxidoreductase [Alphaproteobacteria bacterium]